MVRKLGKLSRKTGKIGVFHMVSLDTASAPLLGCLFFTFLGCLVGFWISLSFIHYELTTVHMMMTSSDPSR